jgi:hypothetical protein
MGGTAPAAWWAACAVAGVLAAAYGVLLLRGMTVAQVAEVRYLSAAEAAQRFGTSAESGPVLLVRQK